MDHRGTPDYPGRVATIVPDPKGVVWGVAYALKGDRKKILAYLDHREKGGYQRLEFMVERSCGNELPVLCYVGQSDLPTYIGPEAEELTAEVIGRAKGPSGVNREYLKKLQSSLAKLKISNPHVDRLVHLLP